MKHLGKSILESSMFLANGMKMLFCFEFRKYPQKIQEAFEERLHFSFQVLSMMLVAFGFVFHTVIARIEFGLPILSSFSHLIVLSHAASLIFLSTLAVFYKKFSLTGIRAMITISFFGGFSHYIYICSQLILIGDFKVLTAFGFAAVYAMGIGMIAVVPFAGMVSNGCFTLIIFTLTESLVWLTPDPLFGSIITILAYGITYSLKVLIWTLICHYVLLDINQKEKIITTERALIHRDLELARQIQDSSAPPREFFWRNAHVTCVMQKHAAVGGDWAAIHQDPSGALNLVVADAMGKGLQAALVIHAVQSLWAQAVSEGKYFDPERWLRSLNGSLYFMGKNATHFVTVGLVRLDDTKCTYWSAAHVPLFLISNAAVPQVRSLLAAGSPIGVNKTPIVSSREVELSDISWLMLGSDGVFTKGSRHSERDILDFKNRIPDNPETMPFDNSVEDDKTLILVQMDQSNQRHLKKAV